MRGFYLIEALKWQQLVKAVRRVGIIEVIT